MSSTKKSITIAAKFADGTFGEDAKRAKKDVEGVGAGAKKAGDDAEESGGKFAGLSKHLLGMVAGAAAGYIGISTLESILGKTKETLEETEKFASTSGFGANASLQFTQAMNARGLSGESASKAAKGLGKSLEGAERQQRAHTEATEKASEKGETHVAQLGAAAEAYQKLGINVQALRRLKPEQQFTDITEALTNLPAGLEKTQLASTLLGKSAVSLMPMLTKGAGDFKNMTAAVREYYPTLKGGQKGLEELEVTQAKGKMAWEGLEFTIGMKVMPIFTKFQTVFAKGVHEMEQGHGVFKTLRTVIGGVVGVTKGLVLGIADTIKWLGKNKVALAALAGMMTPFAILLAVQTYLWLANAVAVGVTAVAAFVELTIAMAPIIIGATAIVVVFGLVAVGIYEVATHFKFFEHVAQDAWGWIEGHWKLLAKILTGPIGIATFFIIEHFTQIVSFVKSIPGKIAAAGRGMWGFIKTEFKDIIDNIIGIWNKFAGFLHFKVPSWVPFIGGDSFGVPKIPLLAEGGIVRRGGLSVVGDRGPELLSLPAGARVDPLPPDGRSRNPPGMWRGSNGNTTIIGQIDGRELFRWVLNEFGRQDARAA